MKHSLENFDIYPLVFPADGEAVINVKPLYKHVFFRPESTVRVAYSPILYPGDKQKLSGHAQPEAADFEVLDNTMVIKQFLPEEQEHSFIVYVTDDKGIEVEWLKFYIYSLKEDLISLRPYKGDFHMHSTFSDGKQCPEYVTASCRKIGLDFMVLTDHHEYTPSLKAIEFAETVPTSMKTFPGEEVHLPDNPVHIVNFGGSFSVNDLADKDETAYRREVEAMASGFPSEMPENIRFQIAASEWAYDRIRSGGGLAMYCHPYWRWNNQYNYIWESSVQWMFNRSKFDILELLGGYHRYESFSNNEQTAYYTQEMIRTGGNVDWAVAGVSDSHDCDGDLFRWFYSILFADNCEFDSLKGAFQAQRSVAVKSIKSECPEIYGDLRYVRYAGFLMKNFYPRHDRLCRFEGELMLRLLAGERGAGEILKTTSEPIDALFSKYWQSEK